MTQTPKRDFFLKLDFFEISWGDSEKEASADGPDAADGLDAADSPNAADCPNVADLVTLKIL